MNEERKRELEELNDRLLEENARLRREIAAQREANMQLMAEIGRNKNDEK